MVGRESYWTVPCNPAHALAGSELLDRMHFSLPKTFLQGMKHDNTAVLSTLLVRNDPCLIDFLTSRYR